MGKRKLVESVLSFYQGPGELTQAIQFGRKHLYLLSDLTSLDFQYFYLIKVLTLIKNVNRCSCRMSTENKLYYN